MEKALTNETQKLAQSMNMDMGIWIWVVSPLSQLFIRTSQTDIFFFQKNQVVSGKTPLTLISPFCVPILFVLALAFERAVLYRNVVFSIVVLSTRKQYTNFSKKVFVFQKIFNFNVRVMKIFKISCDFRKNICQSLN